MKVLGLRCQQSTLLTSVIFSLQKFNRNVNDLNTMRPLFVSKLHEIRTHYLEDQPKMTTLYFCRCKSLTVSIGSTNLVYFFIIIISILLLLITSLDELNTLAMSWSSARMHEIFKCMGHYMRLFIYCYYD